MPILMICNETTREIFEDFFFTEYPPTTAFEICTIFFLESFLVSLDKSVLLHCKCLKSKFSEILILVCRKIFSAFYPILHETFSNSGGFPLMQEMNPFYPHLVVYDRKQFLKMQKQLFAYVLQNRCSY